MAVLNTRDLRAFVRVDGMGRTVAGSLIYRKNQPKVGKWREIRAEECCDPWFPTTTTTSTSTSTTTSTSTSTSTSTTSTTTTAPSDLRLKRNIVLTGAMRGKLAEYSWEWNDVAVDLNLHNFPTKGVIAQEAQNLYPEAVSIANDGYLRVDYSLIK